MTQLPKKYEKRWQAVKKFVETKINPLMMDECYIAAMDGDLIDICAPLVIDEETKEIVVTSDHGAYVIYNGDPDYDDGAHTPSREIIKDLRQRFQIFKEIAY